MKNKSERVMAIDPANRGFGFAVMETSADLIDWGVKTIKDNQVTKYLRKIEYLIEQYQPDVIVMENIKHKTTRRCERVQGLLEKISKLASQNSIKVRCVSKTDIRGAFAEFNASTKHEVATAIAKKLPELSLRLPPFRKQWMSEDYRMSIFDSVAFALTYYQKTQNV